MIYALSRGGNLASSAAGEQQKKLDMENSQFRNDIQSAGQKYAQTAQGNVETARSNLINQLTATEDPAAAARGAVQQASLLSSPPAFDPVGNFAFDTANAVNNVAGPATGYGGYFGSPYSFGPTGKTGKNSMSIRS